MRSEVLGIKLNAQCDRLDEIAIRAWGLAVGDRDAAEVLPKWLELF